ncbi:hypothetical protein DFA_03435 [Cavenderia fasciculata]|uniref:Transmembrane protein n=1 Tax=Cavenderia fasciculata TaxID=261658 RepID=F4PHK3_CACFS|nr:uncharacterized protein DFA_03435 [Cavenderia fasciculata]EGG25187.1 hypothetical protein DFA_03435 [Cavenderia fasciculata]|eukprot:XP_004363038.1 hypothetical protein DFA_03435 [Cavenderia fasciculata]
MIVDCRMIKSILVLMIYLSCWSCCCTLAFVLPQEINNNCTYAAPDGGMFEPNENDTTPWSCTPTGFYPFNNYVYINTNVTVQTILPSYQFPYYLNDLEIGSRNDSTIVSKLVIRNITIFNTESTIVYSPSIMIINNDYNATTYYFSKEMIIMGSFISQKSRLFLSPANSRLLVSGLSSTFELYNQATFIINNSSAKFLSSDYGPIEIRSGSELVASSHSKIITISDMIMQQYSILRITSGSELYSTIMNTTKSKLYFKNANRIQFNHLIVTDGGIDIINSKYYIQKEYPNDGKDKHPFQQFEWSDTYINSFDELKKRKYNGRMELLNTWMNIENSTFNLNSATFFANSTTIDTYNSTFLFRNSIFETFSIGSKNGGEYNQLHDINRSRITLYNSTFKSSGSFESLTFNDAKIRMDNDSTIDSSYSLSFYRSDIKSNGTISFKELYLFGITINEFSGSFKSLKGGLLKLSRHSFFLDHSERNQLDDISIFLKESTLQIEQPRTFSQQQQQQQQQSGSSQTTNCIYLNDSIIINNNILQLYEIPIIIYDSKSANTTSRIINNVVMGINNITFQKPKNSIDDFITPIIENNGYLHINGDLSSIRIEQSQNKYSAVKLNYNSTIRSKYLVNIANGSIGGEGTIDAEMYIGQSSTIGIPQSKTKLQFIKPVEFGNHSTILIYIDSISNFTNLNFKSNVSLPNSKLMIKINSDLLFGDGNFEIINLNSFMSNMVNFSTDIMVYNYRNQKQDVSVPISCNIRVQSSLDSVTVSFKQCMVSVVSKDSAISSFGSKSMSAGVISAIVAGSILLLSILFAIFYCIKKQISHANKERNRIGNNNDNNNKVDNNNNNNNSSSSSSNSTIAAQTSDFHHPKV